jgi:3-dehydroquinate synthase
MSRTATPERTDFRVRDEIDLPRVDGGIVEGRATRSEAYPIFVTGSLDATVIRLSELAGEAQLAVITEEVVYRLHGRALVAALREAGFATDVHVLPAGERSKSLQRALELWDWLAHGSIGRRDLVVSLGGGVINDLGGWVASGYMRGLPYVNLPTTLLAQVDGAIGGKVAVNHDVAKNLIGAFYQPTAVISNVAFLDTLDERQLRSGLAESIKKAVIASPAYWDFIEQNAEAILARDLAALKRLVHCAGAIKTRLVERDPYEEDLRRPLNFGHTVGHPLETITGYGPLFHGEAVAFGMAVESRIAAGRGLLSEVDLERIIGLLKRVGLPTSVADLPVPAPAGDLLDAMEKVRLIRAGSLRYVLPVAFGETVIADDVSNDELRAALARSRLHSDGT